ncbi:MAG: calcium-binding protein [Rivularia sp. (in: cyanobacteria)]
MDKSGEFPKNFIQQTIPETLKFIGGGGLPRVGVGIRFEANLFAPDTDLSDNQPDEILGTKTVATDIVAQIGNGVFIVEIEETINLPDGQIFAKGFQLQPEQVLIPIVGGTDSFKNIRGFQQITPVQIPILFNSTLEKSEEIKGTRGDDDIKGKNASEFIAGNNGNDTLKGRGGNDIIEGGRGGDIIRGGAGNDVLAADRIDRFQDFDGSHSELRGGNGDDIIYGGSKDDIIGGGNDNDILLGKDGDDLIRGGSGFDLLNGGIGNDTLRGQAGIDIADYYDLTFNGVFGTVAGVDVNLDKNQAKHSSNNNALTWTDTLTTIENVQGTTRNDRFIGDENNNVFYGREEVGRDDRKTEFIGLDGKSYKVTGDVVEYDGNQSEFTFGVSSKESFEDGLTVSGSGIGEDILFGIEFIKFDDGLVATDSI